VVVILVRSLLEGRQTMKQLIVLFVILAFALPAQAQFIDVVVCEPQGGGNPAHPDTFWYDVNPGVAARCDFHVEVFDPNPANYTGIVKPGPTWLFSVHFAGGKWWASWWDPGCTNPIDTAFVFKFTNPNPSTWGDWRTTVDGSNNPYAQVMDSSGAHSGELDGYGYRVHVPMQPIPTVSTWGLAILLIVLTGAALVVIRKRRLKAQ
jgi:hypothetical protein